MENKALLLATWNLKVGAGLEEAYSKNVKAFIISLRIQAAQGFLFCWWLHPYLFLHYTKLQVLSSPSWSSNKILLSWRKKYMYNLFFVWHKGYIYSFWKAQGPSDQTIIVSILLYSSISNFFSTCRSLFEGLILCLPIQKNPMLDSNCNTCLAVCLGFSYFCHFAHGVPSILHASYLCPAYLSRSLLNAIILVTHIDIYLWD